MSYSTDLAVWAAHNYHDRHDKIYIVWIDQVPRGYQVTAAWGKASASRVQASQPKGLYAFYPDAEVTAENLIKFKTDYVDIHSLYYRPPPGKSIINIHDALLKIDVSRIVNMNTHQAGSPQPQPTAPAPRPAADPVPAHRTRRIRL